MDIIQSGNYLFNVDLAHAYRVVKIHPNNYPVTGLELDFDDITRTFVDTRLSFGSHHSPFIFNHLTQAVRYIMAKFGYHVICRIDNFLVVTDTFQEGNEAIALLIKVLHFLGLHINYKKSEGPLQE